MKYLRVNYSARFLIDINFLRFLFTDPDRPKKYLTLLMNINKSSIIPWYFNVISDKCFLDYSKENRKSTGSILGALHPENFFDKDLTDSIIKKAISMASKSPYKVFILTGDDNIKDYLDNSHYKTHPNVKEVVKIRSDGEALEIIEKIYNEKDTCRCE